GRVLSLTGPWPIGAKAFAATGEGLPKATLDACTDADAILFGAVGEHPGLEIPYRPELALVAIRERFDLRISVREVRRQGRRPLIFVRNLLGGAYPPSARVESDGAGPATDVFELTPDRIREVIRIAVGYARAAGVGLVSVDKANLMATSRLWRRVVNEV